MAIVIAVASAKGGCGKTTLAILLGAELALDGHRTRILDADVNLDLPWKNGEALSYERIRPDQNLRPTPCSDRAVHT